MSSPVVALTDEKNQFTEALLVISYFLCELK